MPALRSDRRYLGTAMSAGRLAKAPADNLMLMSVRPPFCAIGVLRGRRDPQPSGNPFAVYVELVNAVFLWDQVNQIAGLARGIAFDADSHLPLAFDLGIDEGVRPQMLRYAHPRGPFALRHRKPQMLRAYPDRGGSALGRRGSRNEIHRRGTNKPRNEQAIRLVVEFERRSDLRDRALVEHDDLVGHRHGLDL